MGINLTNRSVKQRTVMHRCPQNGESAINLSVTSVSGRVRFPVLSQMKPRGRSPGGALLSIPWSFNLYSLASEGVRGIGRRRSLVGVVTTARNRFLCKSLRFSSVSGQWGKTQSTCFQGRKKAHAYFLVAGARAHFAAPVGLLLNVENHCGRQLWCRWVWNVESSIWQRSP